MGCDIHMYVEYKRKESDYWRCFGGRINPGRNYFMFGILAGVRANTKLSFDPKGLPEKLGCSSEDDHYLYISDSEESGFCTLERALGWVKYGSKIVEYDGKPWKVENPDHHTCTWLSLEEFSQAIDFYRKEAIGYDEPEYEALLAAMQKLAEFDNDVRVVFWFDN